MTQASNTEKSRIYRLLGFQEQIVVGSESATAVMGQQNGYNVIFGQMCQGRMFGLEVDLKWSCVI